MHAFFAYNHVAECLPKILMPHETKKKTNAVYGSSAACNHRVLPTIHHYYLPKLRGYAASEIDFLLLFNPLQGPLSSSLLTSYHIFIALCTGYFFPLPPPLVRAPHLPKTSSKYEKVNLEIYHQEDLDDVDIVWVN